MNLWVLVAATALGCYALKLLGYLVPARVLAHPQVRRVVELLPVALLAALVVVEAVANGVPAFKPPEAKNAANTLVVMAVLLAILFVGISIVAAAYQIVPSEEGSGGPTVIALVALTITFVALIGRLADGNYWVGALVTGIIEVGLGVFLILRGVRRFGEPSYTLGESREEIRETAAWVARERAS